MDILTTILQIYLGIGILYAIYILLFGYDHIYNFPINVLFGPITLVLNIIAVYTRTTINDYKKMFKNKKVVFFDLDGTIVDTIPYWREAIKKILGTDGKALADINTGEGTTLENRWLDIIAKNNFKMHIPVENLVTQTYTEFIKLTAQLPLEIKDGVVELISKLTNKNIKVALVTNSKKDIVDKILKDVNLDGMFDLIICGDEVKNPKPHPEIYKEALKKLNLEPQDALAFEDSIPGTQAAVAAGISTVCIWDNVEEQSNYPRKVKIFVPDFENLDTFVDETYDNSYKAYLESLKQEAQEELGEIQSTTSKKK